MTLTRRPSRFESPEEQAMARILDTDGRLLAEAALHLSDDDQHIVLTQIAGKGTLLKYYFASAGRGVIVELGEQRAEGRLATRWQGSGRLWLVTLDQPGIIRGNRDPARPASV
jgi:hypothetical protein